MPSDFAAPQKHFGLLDIISRQVAYTATAASIYADAHVKGEEIEITWEMMIILNILYPRFTTLRPPYSAVARRRYFTVSEIQMRYRSFSIRLFSGV